jgi:hypothetical protein
MKTLRWISGISAGITAGLILLIFIGDAFADGIGPILNLTPRETAMMAAFLIMFLGLVLSWKWELVGGIITVCGLAAFYLLDYALSGSFPHGPFFLIFAAPGFLFVYLGWRSRKQGKLYIL